MFIVMDDAPYSSIGPYSIYKVSNLVSVHWAMNIMSIYSSIDAPCQSTGGATNLECTKITIRRYTKIDDFCLAYSVILLLLLFVILDLEIIVNLLLLYTAHSATPCTVIHNHSQMSFHTCRSHTGVGL